jgi:hypothetical protein
MKQSEVSATSIERGTSENVVLSCSQVMQRYTGVSYNIQGYYGKRDASWNLALRCSDKNHHFSNITGNGKDLHDAALNLRLVVLTKLSEHLGQPFRNLFEVERHLDELEDVERNDLGAIVTTEEPLEDKPEDLNEKFQQISDKLSTLIDLLTPKF